SLPIPVNFPRNAARGKQRPEKILLRAQGPPAPFAPPQGSPSPLRRWDSLPQPLAEDQSLPSGARYATDPRPGTNWSGNAAAQVFLPARARELRPRSLPVGSGLHLFST